MIKNGLTSNLLTKEQREKVSLCEERLDSRGIFTRFRVEDQTVFDAFLLSDLIDRHEHDGLVLFVDDVERSGASPASCSLEPSTYRTASYKVGDKVSARWMGFSYVYRFLDREGLGVEANYLLKLLPIMYDWRAKLDQLGLKRVCAKIRPVIGPLSSFYGCRAGDGGPLAVIKSGKRKGAEI
ncbi:MAG TPA: hypothetical protein EYN64_02855 [Flavobacteriales bacterium]|nr:hypothetical protein [Flavobacteriales bacterium]